jgi:hypothetical protein
MSTAGEYEALEETVEILGDEDALDALRESEQDVQCRLSLFARRGEARRAVAYRRRRP